MSLPYSRSDVKDRARAEWRGLCNVTLPSFNASFSGLNEAAIAHDVRHAHELGYWGSLVAAESGTTVEEYKRFLEVAAEAAPESFRLGDYADCLAGFIDALGLGQPHVLGLSFGGGLALELYHRHPEIPKTLVLAGAYAGWAGSLPAEVVEQRLQQALREAERPPEEWLPGYMPGMFTESAPPEMVNEIACPGRTFLAMFVSTRGSSCTDWKSAPVALAKFMLLGT